MSNNDPQKQVAIEIKNPSKYMTLTYAVSLTIIAILSAVVHLVLDEVIAQQSQTGKIVNISGQQRMLSQRAGLFTLHYVTTGEEESKEIAQQAIEKMLDNQAFLLSDHKRQSESPLSLALQRLYFEEPYRVETSVELYSKIITTALEKEYSTNALAQFEQESIVIELAKTSLLEGLHTVVGQYEQESLEKVDDLRFAQNVVFWIIIFTILIEALFIFRPMVAKISQFATKLQRDANYDPLSSVYNRRAFNVLGQQNFGLAKRHKQKLSVIMCDIDFFKKVNDTHGHAVGDDVIKMVAKILTSSIRETDIVARFGGEEFIILLPYTTEDEAIFVAEKIRHIIENRTIESRGKQVTVTISLGVSQMKEQDDNIESIIVRADEALYLAKSKGRNQTVLSEPIKQETVN